MDKRTVVPNARFFQNLVSNVVKHNDRREQQKAATNDLLKAKGKYSVFDCLAGRSTSLEELMNGLLIH